MTNNAIQQTATITKTVNMQSVTTSRLSDNAFYLLALASQLKKLLGPASLQHFLDTGESVVFAQKAS